MSTNYFAKGEPLFESKNSFINDMNRILNHPSSSFSWYEIQENILAFFKQCPSEFHEEIFFKICQNVVSNFGSHTGNNFESVMSTFLNFVNLDIFKLYKTSLPHNIEQRPVLRQIEYALKTDYLKIAENFTDILLSPESKQISNFNDSLIHELSTHRASIRYLIDNYSGWHSKQVLNSLLNSHVCDDALLDKLTSKIGLFNNENINLFMDSLPTLSASRKREILEKYTSYNRYQSKINNFYFDNLINGEFSFQLLNETESFWLKIVQNKEYCTKWLEEDSSKFFAYISILIDNKIVKPDFVWDIVIDYWSLPSSKINNYSEFSKLLDKYNVSMLDDKWINFIFKLEEKKTNSLNTFFINNYKELNFDLTFDIKINGVSYRSPRDYFEKTRYLPYLFQQFSIEKDNTKKIKLMQNIEYELTQNDESYSVRCILDDTMFQDFFNFSKQYYGEQKFFEHWFLEKEETDYSSEYYVKIKLLDLFNKSKHKLEFNTPEDNPLFKFLDKHYSGDGDIFVKKYGDFFTNLNEFFKYKLGLLKRNNISIESFCKQNNMFSDYHLRRFISESPKPKKSMFGLISDKFEPLQIVVQNGQVDFITDKNKLIEAQDIPLETGLLNGTQQNQSSSNNFNELVQQAKKEVDNLHGILDKYADKDLNLEVKIRAENLLLDKITFLENIKEMTADLQLEDIFFLKNNFGKYLTQCIDIYGKSVTRYETFLDPKQKMFKSLEDSDKYKEKIDNEALKQLELLNKELSLVKEHIINQFQGDILHDMKVQTRFLQNRIDNSPITEEDNLLEMESGAGKVVKIGMKN